jgi:hypothetical protein
MVAHSVRWRSRPVRKLRRVDGCGASRWRVGLHGMREPLFVLAARVACGRVAQTQPGAQKRTHGKKTNHQREGEAKGSREEVAHAPTPVDRDKFLLQPATERTVKVHQSRLGIVL